MSYHEKDILDVCCGSKMFWFDNHHLDVLFSDIRELNGETNSTKGDLKYWQEVKTQIERL